MRFRLKPTGGSNCIVYCGTYYYTVIKKDEIRRYLFPGNCYLHMSTERVGVTGYVIKKGNYET